MPLLVDSFGRVHDYLRLSLTDRCNLRCSYCMPEEGIALKPASSYMQRHEIASIARTFVELGVKKIRLTGGEPLLRKDTDEILRDLAALPVELAITTNGILLDKYAPTLADCGIRSINISLDSLREARLNRIIRREHYKVIIRNIHSLLSAGFNVKLNAVIMKGMNDDELVDFVEFTRENKVHYRFIEFMPFGRNKWDWKNGMSFTEMIDKITGEYGDRVERLSDKPHDTAKNYRINGYAGTFAIIGSVTNPFCSACNRIRLTADGKIKNCLFSPTETDLLSALRQGNDIRPLITRSVLDKSLLRGGMDSFEKLADPLLNQNNRSMVAIGG